MGWAIEYLKTAGQTKHANPAILAAVGNALSLGSMAIGALGGGKSEGAPEQPSPGKGIAKPAMPKL